MYRMQQLGYPAPSLPHGLCGNALVKGQSNEIFDLQFFSSFEPAWATDQWVKIFSILVKFSLSYSNFSESPRGMILRRVNLPGVSYCAESISPGYHTPASHLLKFVLKSPRGMIPRRVNLPGVSNCAESISPGYDTPGSQCKELSIRSSNYNSCFTCIYFLVGSEQTGFNSFSKTCLTSSKLAGF